jgi:hypothetical protein
MPFSTSTIAVVCTVLLLAACGASDRAARGAAWNPEEATLFDDGIDVIESFTTLSGNFRFDAEEELNARANLADVILLGDIRSVQQSEDVDGVRTKRITLDVEKVLYGKWRDKEFILVSGQESLGYNLLARHEERLKGRQLAFIRVFRSEDGRTGHHFHLSPGSLSMRDEVEALVAARKKEEDTRQGD